MWGRPFLEHNFVKALFIAAVVKTEKEANKAREKTIAELYNGTFVVYAKVNVADYMIFWLETDLNQQNLDLLHSQCFLRINISGPEA